MIHVKNTASIFTRKNPPNSPKYTTITLRPLLSHVGVRPGPGGDRPVPAHAGGEQSHPAGQHRACGAFPPGHDPAAVTGAGPETGNKPTPPSAPPGRRPDTRQSHGRQVRAGPAAAARSPRCPDTPGSSRDPATRPLRGQPPPTCWSHSGHDLVAIFTLLARLAAEAAARAPPLSPQRPGLRPPVSQPRLRRRWVRARPRGRAEPACEGAEPACEGRGLRVRGRGAPRCVRAPRHRAPRSNPPHAGPGALPDSHVS